MDDDFVAFEIKKNLRPKDTDNFNDTPAYMTVTFSKEKHILRRVEDRTANRGGMYLFCLDTSYPGSFLRFRRIINFL